MPPLLLMMNTWEAGKPQFSIYEYMTVHTASQNLNSCGSGISMPAFLSVLPFTRSGPIFFFCKRSDECMSRSLMSRAAKITIVIGFVHLEIQDCPYSEQIVKLVGQVDHQERLQLHQLTLKTITAVLFEQRTSSSQEFTILQSIFKSFSKFYSLNHHLESHLHKNYFLYIFTLQQLFYILFTLQIAIFAIYFWVARNLEQMMDIFE